MTTGPFTQSWKSRPAPLMDGITSTIGPIRCLAISVSATWLIFSTVSHDSGEPGVPWNSSTTGNLTCA